MTLRFLIILSTAKLRDFNEDTKMAAMIMVKPAGDRGGGGGGDHGGHLTEKARCSRRCWWRRRLGWWRRLFCGDDEQFRYNFFVTKVHGRGENSLKCKR